jgi:hypothetical protein
MTEKEIQEAIENLKIKLTGSRYVNSKKVSLYNLITKINGVEVSLGTTIGYSVGNEVLSTEEEEELLEMYEPIIKDDFTRNHEKLARLFEVSIKGDLKAN